MARLIQIVRVHLDTDAAIGRKPEGVRKPLFQRDHVLRLQHGRRTAAEMDVGHRHARRNARADKRDFLEQALQIGGDRFVALRLLCVASAEPAQTIAIGNVEVKREAAARIQLCKPISVGVRIDRAGKMRCGRVARVTWHRGG